MPILIVDDYNTMIRIMRNLLRQLGFLQHRRSLRRPHRADQTSRTKEYGLVISDWNMAPMAGAELLSQVRADDRYRQTPILMVANDTGDSDEANRAGASSYIVKPFSAQALKTKLEDVLGAF